MDGKMLCFIIFPGFIVTDLPLTGSDFQRVGSATEKTIGPVFVSKD